MQAPSETVEAKLTQAMRLHRQGKPGEARRLCEQVLASDRNHGPARHLLAVMLLESGEAKAAIGHLEILLAAEPNDARAYHSLGTALVRAGRPDEATTRLQRAIRLDPEIIESYLALAQIHLDQDRFDGSDDAVPLISLFDTFTASHSLAGPTSNPQVQRSKRQ